MSDLDFIPISVSTLMPSSTVGLDLYQTDDSSDRLILYRGADFPLAAKDLQKLHQRGITRLYISKEAQSRYQKYLRQLAAAPPDDDRIPMHARVGAMNEVVRDVLTRSLSSDDKQQTVTAANHLGKMVTQTITNSGFASTDLFKVLHHDYTTFTHSANVAYYMAMLGHKLGYSAGELEQLTTAGLLHDIGKLDIAEAILCKPGRLDDWEFREIRKHPLVGFRRLALRPELSIGQLMVVYQHHERLDGTGYPVGIAGDEIHDWAKVCTVVDVFEALTSQRPYRQPMSTQKAIEVIERDSGKAFEPEILACWKEIIATSFNR